MTKIPFGLAAIKPSPIPESKILDTSAESQADLEREARRNEAEMKVVGEMMDSNPSPETRPHIEIDSTDMADDNTRLNRLVAHDFPFDPSQTAAIVGMVREKYACLTGAAGTGKTTVTKALVDALLESGEIDEVNMGEYFAKGTVDEDGDPIQSQEENWVPSICLAAFTGQASQMIKKNFPPDWHPNIMTIHRMLAYMPDYYDDWDDSKGEMVKKMRFIPTYTAENKMPWDVVGIDEAGMQSVDLWANVLAALKPGARVYMIGDINQLPPVHGQSIFGYALQNWPSWELTEVHRQVGVNNSIVDNAWRILQGKSPLSDAPKEAKLNLMDKQGIITSLNWMVTNQNDWKFITLQIPDDQVKAAKHIRLMLDKLQGHLYDPIRDCVITAINGLDGSNGRFLGQIPMNLELALSLNHDGQRYFIDAGRERKSFGIGEKVMNTRNDHAAGITNGMTGIVLEINENANYNGDRNRFGKVEEVAEYMKNDYVEDDGDEISFEEIAAQMNASIQQQAMKKEKEKKERGDASHSVVVQFGFGEHARSQTFRTLAEVASLMTAYVVTCHKMQGAECPHIFTICHATHKQMLFREWLYTAVTRASQKCVLLYTPFGLMQALNKQRIKGTTLAEKARSFQELQRDESSGNLLGYKVELPEPMTLDTSGDYEKKSALIQHVAPPPPPLKPVMPQPQPKVVINNLTQINIETVHVTVQRDPERREGKPIDVTPTVVTTPPAPKPTLSQMVALAKPQPKPILALPAPLPIRRPAQSHWDTREVTRPMLTEVQLNEAVAEHQARMDRELTRSEPYVPPVKAKPIFGFLVK